MVQHATRETDIARPVQPQVEACLEGSQGQARAVHRCTIETVTCPTCQAVYAPAPQQEAFLTFSRHVLEAAFMETCHFCFRCRRTACPQCWDFVHGVCAACDQEAGLPFRVEAPPLEGLLFPPPRLTSPHQEEVESSFVCLHTGRFQTQPSQPPPPQPSPSHAQARAESSLFAIEISRAFPQEAAILELQRDAVAVSEVDDGEDKDDKDELDGKPGLWKHVERVLLIITVLVLLTLIVTIVLAELLVNVNVQIARFAHIDIRAEIAYLLQVVGHIFKR